MKVKVLMGHKPECAFVQWAHLNPPPAWYPTSEEMELDAAGGMRGRGYRWIVYACPDATRCDARCIVRFDTILDAIHEAVGVPLQRAGKGR
jgi:hypothetical protein